MKRIIAATLIAIFGSLGVGQALADPTGIAVGDTMLAERVQQLSVSEFWQLGPGEVSYPKQANPPGGVLSLWLHDYEQAPRDGDWVAVGLIGVGFGDLGEVPVLVRLWAKSPSEIMGAKIAVSERRAQPGQATAFDINFRGQYILLATTPSGAVQLDGQHIGAIE